MTDLSESRSLVAKIEADICKAGLEIERLIRVKREPALEVAKGDGKAAKQLDQLNDRLRRAELHRDDLAVALDQAKAELATLEATEQRRLDGERADQIEQLAAALAESSSSADTALEGLARALEARGEVAQRLMAVLPGEAARELSHKLAWGPVVRAARAVGLSQWLRLPHYEVHHCIPLRAMFPIPEVREAVAKLRGDIATDREAA